MIKKIATVAVYVEDQAQAKAFWTEKIGFVVNAERQMSPDATWLEVGPQGAESMLVIYPKALTKNYEEMKAAIVFHCTDLQAYYDRLKTAGVEFLSEPQKMPWGTFAQFKDPDGNLFLLKEE
jgi:lactoylglutathione lyase